VSLTAHVPDLSNSVTACHECEFKCIVVKLVGVEELVSCLQNTQLASVKEPCGVLEGEIKKLLYDYFYYNNR
jgi:hypothetical protein